MSIIHSIFYYQSPKGICSNKGTRACKWDLLKGDLSLCTLGLIILIQILNSGKSIAARQTYTKRDGFTAMVQSRTTELNQSYKFTQIDLSKLFDRVPEVCERGRSRKLILSFGWKLLRQRGRQMFQSISEINDGVSIYGSTIP